VVMESTGTYWKGIYYLLEAEGLDCWLVNARDVKNLPGRAKTDLLTELPQGVGGGCVPAGVRLADTRLDAYRVLLCRSFTFDGASTPRPG